MVTGQDACKGIEQMTDRELLHHLAGLVCTYDSKRDEELEYLADHPNRDMWGREEDDEYRGIMDEIHEQYGVLRKTIDHINERRRP